MKDRASKPKIHHFVPRSYLARFTDDEGFLHVFDRSSDQFRRQRPKEIMRINSYYRQAWVPAGVDPDILEKGLGEWLEADAKDCIDRLIRSPSQLDDIDTATLLRYIELQRIRVPRQAQSAKELMRNLILRLASPEATAAIRAGEVLLTIKDSARFDYMRMLIGQLDPWFGRMDWEVIEAEKGSAFVTTDSPVSFYNEKFFPPIEPGLALAGTIVFFPLSSRHMLLMRHPEYAGDSAVSPLLVVPKPPDEDGSISITHGAIWDSSVVANLNWKLIQLSDRFIVAESREVLDRSIKG